MSFLDIASVFWVFGCHQFLFFSLDAILKNVKVAQVGNLLVIRLQLLKDLYDLFVLCISMQLSFPDYQKVCCLVTLNVFSQIVNQEFLCNWSLKTAQRSEEILTCNEQKCSFCSTKRNATVSILESSTIRNLEVPLEARLCLHTCVTSSDIWRIWIRCACQHVRPPL